MQDSIITIRTLECDICNRFDSVNLSDEEINVRCKSTDMGIGAYSIVHGEHTRIIYFDEKGKYLGDTIALSQDDIPETIQTQPLPYFIRSENKQNWFAKVRKSLFSKFHSKNLTISVAGPSRAGKTSIVRYLDTLIPERDATYIPSVPTMGKSTKHLKIGKCNVKTLDMGGQQDFWDLWENAIRQSDVIFFLIDATSNNQLEVAKAFERVIQYRRENTPVLVFMNKKDLVLRGEAHHFMTSGEFLAITKLKLPIPHVIALDTSVFEGIAYVDYEEVPLATVVDSFLQQYS